MAYIYPAPGVADRQAVLTLSAGAANLVVPALQDITINAANDVFTWTQLNETAKLQVATTSTNSLSMNLVLDKDTFFGADQGTDGDYAGITSITDLGVFGASVQKTLVTFDLYMGDESDDTAGVTITGSGYVTGLAPTVSADAPVWVSPITITVTGEYSVDTTGTN